MANNNAVNLRPSYKTNTLGARKQLPRGPNGKYKFVTANTKTSTSVNSNALKQATQ